MDKKIILRFILSILVEGLFFCLAEEKDNFILNNSNNVKNLTSPPIVTSASQRFLIISTNPTDALSTLSWADTLINKLEDKTSLKFPIGPWHKCYIKLSYKNPDFNFKYSIIEQAFIQILDIPFKKLNTRENGILVTHCYINAILTERNIRNRRRLKEEENFYFVRPDEIRITPLWFAGALFDITSNYIKESHRQNFLMLFNAGKINSLTSILNQKLYESNESIAGMLFYWILSNRNKEKVLSKILDSLCDIDNLSGSEWIDILSTCYSDLPYEISWRDFVIKLQNTMFIPGKIGPADLEFVRRRFYFYPGEDGIPLNANPTTGIISFYNLISLRNLTWVKTVTLTRANWLKIYATGKGNEFQNIINQYINFLLALSDEHMPEEKLKQMLKNAEDSFNEFYRKLKSDKYIEGDINQF